MNASSALIGEDRAKAVVAGIGDPIKRRAIGLIVDEVVQFYKADTTRLQSPFDLEFFVDVLTYDIHNLSKLLRGIVDVASYWREELPKPEIWTVDDAARDHGVAGIRVGQGHNYCALHEDKWIGAALRSLLSASELKQKLMSPRVHHHPAPGNEPATPAIPAKPLDHLFLVMAVDHAFRPGSPARGIVAQVS